MYYVYILRSLKNKKLYTGYTSDLENRLKKHNTKQGGEYTSKNAPFEILFYEAFRNKRDATKAEKFWKTGYGREVLKDKIKYSLERYPVV